MERAPPSWKIWAAAGAGVTAGCLALRCVLQRGAVIRETPQGPLAGVRVVECAINIAGPWSAGLLTQLGAEVIKVEALDLPDSVRGLGPAPVRGMGSCFGSVARGKRSIVLNLKDQAGREALWKLAKWADVFVQNYRPGAVSRIGISYEDLKVHNKDIIYLSSSGFGQSGPLAGCRVYDPVIQCISGTCEAQKDRTTGQPMLVIQPVWDKINGTFGAQAIAAALLARDRGAGGQHLDIQMISSALMCLWPDCYAQHVWQQDRKGSQHEGAVMDELLRTQGDGDGQTPEQAAQDPALRKYFGGGRHVLFGEFRLPRFPAAFSGTPLAERPCCPMLGEHTVKVLRELGYSAAAVQDMLGLGEGKHAGQPPATSTHSLLLRAGEQRKASAFRLLELLQGGAGLHSAPARCRDVDPKECAGHAAGGRSPAGPLDGVKVLDLGHFFAGPFCCALLADQGASVIKVEQVTPDGKAYKWDPTRSLGPQPAPDGGAEQPEGMGATYVALNRNKRSMLLGPGSDMAQRLVRWADVVVADGGEDSPFGSRFSYEACKQWNPRVVYAEIRKNGGELHCQRRSGMTAVQLDAAGKPSYVATPIVEICAGLYAATSVCAALFARNRGSGGQHVAVDMMAVALHFGASDFLQNSVWRNPKAVPRFPSVGAVYSSWYRPTGDGRSVFCALLTDKEWVAFVEEFMPHRKDLLVDPSLPGRLANHDEVVSAFTEAVRQVPTSDEMTARAQRAGVPCAVSKTREEVTSCPQIDHIRSVVKVATPCGPSVQLARSPVIFEGTPTSVRLPAPLPGAHTDEVVEELRGVR
eukprot:TRINITY_DN18601_c0_g1_i1.p1 TRINITY_DN18601_c0_g1~~TRINITY_DN18601_c0_g1_i1.p1  ORF type:complete len:840 (+),score=186.98 TRINITY_DN18601_c0_g1_i1:94-2520(+)